MVILKKSDLINGKNNVNKVTIQSLGKEVYLRPLTRGEATEIEEIQTKSMGRVTRREQGRKPTDEGTSSDMSFNVHATTVAQRNAELRAVYYGLDNEKYIEDPFTEEDIDTLFTREQFMELYDNVSKISGIGEYAEQLNSEVENFPKNK